jgi:hypothetical protein
MNGDTRSELRQSFMAGMTETTVPQEEAALATRD